MRDLLAQDSDTPEQEQQKALAVQSAVAKIQDMTAGANLKNAKAGREQALTHQDHASAAGSSPSCSRARSRSQAAEPPPDPLRPRRRRTPGFRPLHVTRTT